MVPTPTTLRGRVAAVLIAFVAVMVLAAAASTIAFRSWSDSLDDRGESRNAAREVADLRLAYSDQETGVRGYQLSGEPDTLAPYHDGSARAQQLLAALRQRDLGETDLIPYLDAVDEAAATWRTAIAVETIDDPDAAPPTDEAIASFGRVREALDELERVVSADLAGEVDRAERQRALTIAVLIAGLASALLCTALVTVLFRRWVLVPLATISRSARRLGADDTASLPDFGIAELEDVADAIRTMQASLAQARDRAVVAYEALAQSAVLALHVRSQLSNELGELPAGWQVDSMLEPASGVVAGDCYDLGLLDPHTIYLVMVDVTGHGAVAALDALKAKSQLRAALRSRLAPGAALEWLAKERATDPEADLMTALVVRIDVETGVCEYANAGHPPMLIGDGSGVQSLEPTGPLIGAFESTWATRSTTIAPGDALVAYTDGVTDTLGPDRERFGDERLLESLQAVSRGPIEAVAAVRSAVEAFRVGARADDLTLVVIRRPPLVESTPGETVEIATMPA
jgi:serine phosphatase RsbU (regulator of sigma subunit)/CHASE3 domain sensor protein